MHKRQAPQEIIETNEVDEADGDDWNEGDEKMGSDFDDEEKSEESEAPDF